MQTSNKKGYWKELIMKMTKDKYTFNWGLIFIGFLLFIFAPFELFFSNIDDLWFTVYHFAPYLLIGFMIYAVLTVCWEFLIAKHFAKVWDAIACVLFCLVFACYIQGNFFLVNYGQLDGQPIDWSKYKTAGMFSIGMFITAILVAIILIVKVNAEKRKKIINVISICLILVQLFTLTTLIITKDGFQKKENYVDTTKNEWNYGTKSNFNILVLDAFDSRVFYDLLQSEYGDEMRSLFQNFTYYRNTTNVFNHTDFSVPQIITGQNYLNDEFYGDYINHAYEKSPLLQELQKENYELNIYTTTRLPQNEFAAGVANWKKVKLSVSSHKRLLEYIYKLVGFRYLPQPLKQSCWFYSDEMDDLKCISYEDKDGNIVEDDKVFDWSNKIFYDEVNQLKCSDVENSFHFYHIKGLHVVRNLDENFNDAKDVSLEETARGMFNLLNRYFDALKEQGIYDDSVIIIMADHAANEYEEIRFLQCPLLLVKGTNEKHEFIQSELPISYEDLQTGYNNLLKNTNIDNIFEVEDEPRIRYMYDSKWKGRPMTGDEYSEDMSKFAIEGDAFESEKIKDTGEVITSK